MEAIGQLLLELLLLGTGHAALWVLTLGRWQGYRSRGRMASFWDNFLATMMGFLVWVVIVILVILALYSAGFLTQAKEQTAAGPSLQSPVARAEWGGSRQRSVV